MAFVINFDPPYLFLVTEVYDRGIAARFELSSVVLKILLQ
jgi:hypothetical protein